MITLTADMIAEYKAIEEHQAKMRQNPTEQNASDDLYISQPISDEEYARFTAPPPTRWVSIPAQSEHNGFDTITIRLVWTCPVCAKPRGQIRRGTSYDGSRRLSCDTWENPCDHVDKYSDMRREAIANGLNPNLRFIFGRRLTYQQAPTPAETNAADQAADLDATEAHLERIARQTANRRADQREARSAISPTAYYGLNGGICYGPFVNREDALAYASNTNAVRRGDELPRDTKITTP